MKFLHAAFTLVLVSFPVRGEIEFPKELGDFTYAAFQNYETQNPGLGYSHSYHAINAKVSIYIYDRGLTDIPNDIESPMFVDELEVALKEFRAYAKQKQYKEVTIHLHQQPGKIGPLLCRLMMASYIEDTSANITWTCLMPYHGDFLKIRYTFLPQSNAKQRERLFTFGDALGKFLSTHASKGV